MLSTVAAGCAIGTAEDHSVALAPNHRRAGAPGSTVEVIALLLPFRAHLCTAVSKTTNSLRFGR